jgi:high-affinity nickel permease
MAAPTPLALDLALISAALLGFRHGFDHDHVAAITDIASVEKSPRQAMKMGLLYAAGHAATVAALGTTVILLQRSLPAGMDAWMERVVGVTLLALGFYVLWTAIVPRAGHAHAPRTRIVLLVNAVLWAAWRVRKAFRRASVERYGLFRDGIGKAPAFAVGVIHGLGAETPSQILLFLLAVNLGGVAKGLLGLGTFIVGMIAMNTLICAVAAGAVKVSAQRPRAFQWMTGLAAAYSIVVGAIFLLGPTAIFAVVGR